MQISSGIIQKVITLSLWTIPFLTSCTKEDERSTSKAAPANYYTSVKLNGVTYAISDNTSFGGNGIYGLESQGGWAMSIVSNIPPYFGYSLPLGDGVVGTTQTGILFTVLPSTVYSGGVDLTITKATAGPQIIFEGSFSGLVRVIGTNDPLVPISGSFRVSTL